MRRTIHVDSRRPRGCAALRGRKLAYTVYFSNIRLMDFSAVAGFDWTAGNARKSAVKDDVSEIEAEQVFFNQPLLVVEDAAHSQTDSRWHALGVTDAGRCLHITFTLRAHNTLLRVISARAMSHKERKLYEQAS